MHRLTELLAAPDPDMAQVALAIATDFDPKIDVSAALALLDRAAKTLETPRPSSSVELTRLLAECVHDRLGLTANEQDFHDPRNSYLNAVLERKRGIPISLSVVWMAVGLRAEIPVEGIGFPGHFIVRVGGADGTYADPFHRGRILGPSELSQLAHRYAGTDVCDEYLVSIPGREIAARMLVNLKIAFERRGDHALALLACDRAFDLTGRPCIQRDRGVHALALRSYSTAMHDLTAYLALTPDAPDATAISLLIEQARAHLGDAPQ